MPGGPRLEMALLEIVGLIPLAIIFFCVRKKNQTAGWYTWMLFIYYGLLRFVLDFWRAIDIPVQDARWFGLTPAQYFAIILAIIGYIQLKKLYGKRTN